MAQIVQRRPVQIRGDFKMSLMENESHKEIKGPIIAWCLGWAFAWGITRALNTIDAGFMAMMLGGAIGGLVGGAIGGMFSMSLYKNTNLDYSTLRIRGMVAWSVGIAIGEGIGWFIGQFFASGIAWIFILGLAGAVGGAIGGYLTIRLIYEKQLRSARRIKYVWVTGFFLGGIVGATFVEFASPIFNRFFVDLAGWHLSAIATLFVGGALNGLVGGYIGVMRIKKETPSI